MGGGGGKQGRNSPDIGPRLGAAAAQGRTSLASATAQTVRRKRSRGPKTTDRRPRADLSGKAIPPVLRKRRTRKQEKLRLILRLRGALPLGQRARSRRTANPRSAPCPERPLPPYFSLPRSHPPVLIPHVFHCSPPSLPRALPSFNLTSPPFHLVPSPFELPVSLCVHLSTSLSPFSALLSHLTSPCLPRGLGSPLLRSYPTSLS